MGGRKKAPCLAPLCILFAADLSAAIGQKRRRRFYDSNVAAILHCRRHRGNDNARNS